MYQHDIARSGVSAEAIKTPLVEQWVFRPTAPPAPAWADPQPVPLEGNLERPRVKFDDAFHAVAAGGRIYFGSSGDHKLYCLDARTGRTVWSFYTGGPVRLAPAIAGGRVFFASDDGFVYCLDAVTGALVWQVRGGPTPERVLGHGRMVSLWPIRSGVLVDGDTVYFTAGIFPGERVYVRAVRASDGSPVWNNDTLSDRSSSRDGFSPQGYLLASATTLFVPTGRNLPAALARADGSFLYQRGSNWRAVGMLGGTYALLQGDQLYTGSEEQVAGVPQATGALGSSWFPGKRVLFADGLTYMVDERSVVAFDSAAYPEASRTRKTLAGRRVTLLGTRPKPKDFDAQLRKLDEEAGAAQKVIDSCTRWSINRTGLQTLVAAGDTLFAGGKGEVAAYAKGTGAALWQAKVDGTVRGMAISDGRVLASTDTGAIYCFAAGEAPAEAVHTTPAASEPFADDALSRFCKDAAKEILSRSGVSRGYCLVLGGGSGRLAYALARASDLTVYAVDPDAAKVAEARKLLDAGGVYGTRVIVDQGAPDALPYPDYFANLVVSEEALLSGKVSTSPAEVARVLKPCGGVLCIGQPGSAPRDAAKLDEASLKAWAAEPGLAGTGVSRRGGLWAKLTRGPLEGAADWTHQYGNSGNTASSEDTRVRCPLGVLWYGEPGPNKVPSRHLGNAAPLCVGGRVYLQGENRVMCFDAYNGQPYWERQLPGAYRVAMVSACSNIAANEKGIFVAAGDACFLLDALTGKTVSTYKMPPSPSSQKPRWSYVAVVGDTLFGAVGLDAQHSSMLFALDVKSGKPRWVYAGTKIRDNAIVISEGRVFLADHRATSEQRQEALKPRVAELMARKGITAAAAEQELRGADVRIAVALDAARGKVVWERPVDLTDCGMHVLVAMASRGVLVFAGAHANGHYWPQFLSGEYAARRAVAVSTKDGSILWSKPIGYRLRPIIIGDLLVAEPWAFDLRTGQQKMRVNPVTGEPSIWEFERPGHHCGTIAGSPNGLFFRSYSAAYYDLVADQGTEHFSGQRPGCWINMIPSGGVVLMPEASSGCICLFSIHCTTVFKPRETHKTWGMFADRAPILPVKRLSLNLGGAGDRTDASGKLWLAYPRPSGRMQLKVDATIKGEPGGGYFGKPGETATVQGTTVPWAFASGYNGLSKLTVPLLKPDDGAAVYTVRLGFADAENTAEGQRVFDIKIGDRVVEHDFDVIRAAGGPNRAVVREYPGIQVDGDLKVELVSKAQLPPSTTPPAPVPPEARRQLPLLNVLEVERERVLHVGLKTPSLTLSDLDKEQAAEVAVSNYTDKEFAGTLRLQAPAGFTVTPASAEVRLAQGQRTAIPVRLTVARPGARGTLAMPVSLVRADGTVEVERDSRIEYLGARRRVVVPASADAYVNAGSPAQNFGPGATILVDGGSSEMGDESHNVGYLRFPLDVPGKVVSVVLRIRTTPAEASESNDSGRIYLVKDAWDENAIAYSTRPKPGAEVGVLGRVGRDTWEERPLKADLAGLKELCLAIVPTSTDGASYISREGKLGPELVVEYEP